MSGPTDGPTQAGVDRPPRAAGDQDIGATKPVVMSPRSSNMRAIRRTDTKPEVQLRSALHRAGYRFRKDMRLTIAGTAVRPDIVFTRRRVAVFVDGCFWHSCPQHGHQPKVNQTYWQPKLAANSARDQRQTATLRAAGWTVLRIWEHTHVDHALAMVQTELQRLPLPDSL